MNESSPVPFRIVPPRRPERQPGSAWNASDLAAELIWQ